MFCPSVPQQFYGCSKFLLNNYGMKLNTSWRSKLSYALELVPDIAKQVWRFNSTLFSTTSSNAKDYFTGYHNDSLDTLLYVRFAIQNLEFYEWKLGDHGWALSWHRTHTLFALWPDVTSCFTYEKTESEEVFSIVSYIRFKNLQFHWRIYNSIGVCILMRGVQWALWLSPLRGPSAWAISGLQPSSVRGERRSVG